MTTRRRGCSSVTDATRWSRSFSTLRVAAARRARPHNRASMSNVVSSTRTLTIAPHRVAAMVLRYLYLLRSSWTRLLELIYWPAVQLLVWGFLQFYIAQNSGF